MLMLMKTRHQYDLYPNHNAVFSHGTMNKEVCVDDQMTTEGSNSGASQVEMAFFPHNGDFLL